MKDNEAIARTYLSQGIQHWGQPIERRIAAAQAVIDAAGFDAKVTCYPFDEKAWDGPDGAEAQLWLARVSTFMPWGKFEAERDHICDCIVRRRLASGPHDHNHLSEPPAVSVPDGSQ